jgi:hypothetical protein
MIAILLFVGSVCLLPWIIITLIDSFWKKLLFKRLLSIKWGKELTKYYYDLQHGKLIKDQISGLLTSSLPDKMKEYIYNIEAISGIIQYGLLGIFIYIGSNTLYSYYNHAIGRGEIMLISIVNAIWLLIILRVPWLPVLTALIVFIAFAVVALYI